MRPLLRNLAMLGPVGVAVLAALIALGFVVCRWTLAADRDVSAFIVAGTTFTDPAAVDPPIHVFATEGYDGQFYYRLALDPFATSLTPVEGIALDDELRVTRITYPALVFLASFGNDRLVKWALVFVNVVAIGIAAGAAAEFARRRGRLPIFGLLVVASSGLVMSISRDLCEPTMIAGLVGGIALLDRRAYVWAGVAWTAAVLAHEQALIVVGAYALSRLVQLVRRRVRPGRADLVWLIPGAGFVGWQVARAAATGGLPILSSRSASVGLPFVGLLPELAGWVSGDLARQEILVFPELALLAATVVVAAMAARALPAEDRWLVYGLAASVLVAISLSRNVWVGPAELRQLVIVPTISWLVIIAGRHRPPTWLIGGTAAVWLAVAALRSLAV